MNAITTTTLTHTHTDGTVWPTHYFQDDPYTETARHNPDLPASELLAHEAWVMDGVDDIDRVHPVDVLLAAWREEGIFTATTWSVSTAAKDYVGDCIRRKRWMLAHVPPVGTLLTIVGDTTCHYLPEGTKAVVVGKTPSNTPHHPSGTEVAAYGRREGTTGSSFYVRRAEYDGHPTDERWANLLVAERDVAPWWSPMPKVGDLVDWTPNDDCYNFGEPGPFYVDTVDLGDCSFRIRGNANVNATRWIFPRTSDRNVGGNTWSLHDNAASAVAEPNPETTTEPVPMVPLAHVREAMTIISEVYNRAADRRNWCSEADQVTREVNGALARAGLSDVFELETRETTISGWVEVNVVVPVRMRFTDISVSQAASEDEREDAIREAFRNDDTYTAMGCIELEYGWSTNIDRSYVDWEDDCVSNASITVD